MLLPPRIGAILLDLDGTLTDTRAMGESIIRDTMRRWGRTLTADEEERYGLDLYHWTSAREDSSGIRMLGATFYQAGRICGLTPPHAAFYAALCFVRVIRDYPSVPLLPEAPELLDALKGAGWPLGLVTSSTRRDVASKFDEGQLARWLSTVITRDDVRAQKPAPEGLLTACERLGIAPGEAVFVGDMPTDLRAARRAGMPAIGLHVGFSSRQALEDEGPVAVVDSLTDAVSLLLAHQGVSCP